MILKLPNFQLLNKKNVLEKDIMCWEHFASTWQTKVCPFISQWACHSENTQFITIIVFVAIALKNYILKIKKLNIYIKNPFTG